MAKVRKFSVNTLDALAVAIDVFRNQNNRILPYGEKPSNKEMISNHFINQQPIPTQLLAEADAIRGALSQRAMMNTLTGKKNNDFLMSINKALEKDSISNFEFGSLAWAPKLYEDSVKADNDKEQLLGFLYTSQYVSRPGKRCEITFHCIRSRYLSDYNSFVHHGHDGQGNLITFFNKNKFDGIHKITARVKKHETDSHLSNVKTTVINYVKELNEK